MGSGRVLTSLVDAENLVDWINGPPDPRVAELIDVRGLGGELARIALFDIVAVDGEPSIVGDGDEYTVAGVRLSVRLIDLIDWSFNNLDFPACDLDLVLRCDAGGHELDGIDLPRSKGEG